MHEQGLAVMAERNQVAAVSGCTFTLGCLALAEGRLADAEPHLRRSLEISRDGGNVLFELWVLPVLCELYLATGRAAEAAACVERGFSLLAPGRNWYGLPAGMHLARGLLAREQRDWDEANGSFERAVSIDRQHGLSWDEAKTELEWARMLRARHRTGDDDAAARERLAHARQIFERIGARRDVERVLAAGG
jgi:tetratricopeptide (TPR) repeat protein